MKIREEIGRLILKLIFYPRYHFVFTYQDFDPKRKDPYFLIANHASLNDPLYVELNLKEYPYPITGNLLYTNPWYNFLLTKISTSIAKRKGQNDIQTIRGIIHAFNHDRRGIMIFPEGNASYFGEQTNVSYVSTAKLIKKIKHEVVLAKISGGYLASPRWGKRRKKGDFHIHYETLLNVSDIDRLSIQQIEEKLEQAIKFNDYDWNRKEKIIYKSKEKAIGLERYIYYCPICGGLQTIKTIGNDIHCTSCGQIAHINAYEFLEGLPFDNLIEWNHIQKTMISEVVKKPLYSNGRLIEIDFAGNRRIVIGDMSITLDNGVMILTNKKKHIKFEAKKISGLVLTQQKFLSFDYEDKTYLIRIEDPMIFLDSINYIKGE